MALRLRVLGTRAERLGERSSRVFGVHGGRIGRAADNDWVLPDPERYLSGHHAFIEYRGGQWFLVDTSSNGTFVNGSSVPVGRQQVVALGDGDKVRMGDYEFLVSVNPDNDFPPDASAIAAFDEHSLRGADFAIATHGDLGAELDLGRLLADPNAPPDDPEPTPFVAPAPPAVRGPIHVSDAYGQSVPVPASRPKAGAATGTAGAAQVAAAAPQVLPAMPTIAPRAPVAPARTEVAAAAPAVPANALQAFYRAAGLDPSTMSADDAATQLALAGQLLRELALGLMTTLQQRAEQKQRYRVEDTGITQVDLNPFKLSASVDEALARLFATRSTRLPAPVEAVRAAFADVRKHEKATLAAMQDALAEYLHRFAPVKLEEQFDSGLKRAGLGAGDKARYWELYAEFYRVLTQANDAGVPHAFAEEFAKAYETAAGAERMREELRRRG